MQPLAPPQYSADGRWWWNGRSWVPVTWPIATWEKAWPDDDGSDEPRRRAPAALWVGLVALVLLLLLAYGGAAVTWMLAFGSRAA